MRVKEESVSEFDQKDATVVVILLLRASYTPTIAWIGGKKRWNIPILVSLVPLERRLRWFL